MRSISPMRPMAIVVMRTVGPTRAKRALIVNAFSRSFTFNISNPAIISINPDIRRKVAIAKTAFSKIYHFICLLIPQLRFLSFLRNKCMRPKRGICPLKHIKKPGVNDGDVDPRLVLSSRFCQSPFPLFVERLVV